MQTIRLARAGRRNLPFFRVVLTDHRKPAKSGYTDVLGWYNPIRHEQQLDIDKITSLVGQGAQMSERVAKMAYNVSQNDIFKKFFVIRNTQRSSKDTK